MQAQLLGALEEVVPVPAAAGAIGAREGLKYAFESGADFICLGMFDFQVKQDVELACKAIEESKNRKRPWIA